MFYELSEKQVEALRQVLDEYPRVHTAPGKLPAVLDEFRYRLEPPRVMERIIGFPDGEPPGVSDPGLNDDEVKGLAALESALETTSGRSRDRVAKAISDLQHKRDGTWDPDEYEQRAGLQCPYCAAVAWDGAEEGVRVVDIAVRWSSFGYREDPEDGQRSIHGDYDDKNADFDGDHYECEACGHEVALPDGIEEDGW